MFMLAFCEYPHNCMSVVDLRVCAACGWLAAPLEFSGVCVLLFGQLLFVLYLSIYSLASNCAVLSCVRVSLGEPSCPS